MASLIRVDPEEMAAAALSCDDLARRIDECRVDCLALNARLQACYEGQSAVAFDEFCQAKAAPLLNEVHEFCAETARAIRHTCEQFENADGALAGTFRT
jgi:WXG100 family type VII secretion target